MSQVGVGVACFVWRDGKFLMQKRIGSHGKGTWAVPGGHLEFGESFEQAVVREVMEETGMEIENIRYYATTNDIFAEGKHYVTVWMQADWKANEPRITEPDRCLEQRWVTPSNLPSPLFEPCYQNLRVIKPEFFA